MVEIVKEFQVQVLESPDLNSNRGSIEIADNPYKTFVGLTDSVYQTDLTPEPVFGGEVYSTAGDTEGSITVSELPAGLPSLDIEMAKNKNNSSKAEDARNKDKRDSDRDRIRSQHNIPSGTRVGYVNGLPCKWDGSKWVRIK